MTVRAPQSWLEANQRYLSVALGMVRAALERHSARRHGDASAYTALPTPGPDAQRTPQHAADELPAPSALDMLCAAFGLSPFERDLLLLCAGMEFDASFAALCAAAQGDSRRAYPTFSLGLAALPESHWSALTPAAPLRYWRLIEVGAGDALTTSPLRIDERVLHYLAGVPHLDERLRGLISPLQAVIELASSHQLLVQRIIEIWSRVPQSAVLPIVQLCGHDQTSKRAIAATACQALGIHLQTIRAPDVPAAAAEREALTRLWEREAVFSNSALLIDADDSDSSDHPRASLAFVEGLRGMLLVSSREPLRLRRPLTIRLDVSRPTSTEQLALWQGALGSAATRFNGQVESIVSQFDMSVQSIYAASVEALSKTAHLGGRLDTQQSTSGSSSHRSASLEAQVLWEACRAQARPRLDDLAQRLEAAAAWADLVLPEAQRQLLGDIVAHVRQRARVYRTWGFAAKGSRGLGISTLFAGPSGTGKTMAAEVLANELRLDLYRIDLSQVVSKYIGETEKNLRRVFDAAEEGGAILLFDEADALFGKRSEVKDSHDRYANIEVSYLLQRMESYAGLAILTTNMKSALDQAFLRRIRFVVQFPFPDAAQRAEIWRRIFPPETPTVGLNAGKLARLNVAGGNIRNIALHAAFLAADSGEPVGMVHLLRAARSEYVKLEKSLTEAEIGGWV